MSDCASHCPHEIHRNEARSGNDGWMNKTEQCCHCGEISVLHFTLEPRGSDHGRYARTVWVRVATR